MPYVLVRKLFLSYLFIFSFTQSCTTKPRRTFNSFEEYLQISKNREPYDSKIESSKKALFVFAKKESRNRSDVPSKKQKVS